MAVRNNFAAGEVLAAADLNDTFAAKATKTTASSAPGSPTTGDIWFDTTTSPATPKFWTGSAWVTFSAGAADFSNAASGTYSSGGINYKWIQFTASGTLTVTKSGFADVLVVGGGGGGWNQGGGGAGGYLAVTNTYLATGTLTVTVGAGGAARLQGVPSRLDSLYAVGGGNGRGGGLNLAGTLGGSGGGGGTSNEAGGSGVSGQGNNGGTAGTFSGGGGGGGAGAAGTAGVSQTGGAGGAGTASSITGTSVTRAGGGGGGGFSGGGAGGTGGGGAGSASPTPATAGTANTGGGGGGMYSEVGATGAAGGSGVVIVRVRT